MNNTLRYALTMVFAGAFLPTVFGQEAAEPEVKHEETSETTEAPVAVTSHEDQAVSSPSFPDSPQNHWAFEALSNLKKHGVLQGYPDGFFRGARIPTRYEMAYAVNAAYTKLMGLHDSLQGQVKALEDSINGAGNIGADLKALRDQLSSVQGSLDSMKTYGDDLANLKKLADTFKDDLSKMGVDVQALKKDLSTLEARVTKLEKRRHTIDFRGDANVVGLFGFGKDENAPGLNSDARLVGTGKMLEGSRSRNAEMYHEIGLTMTSTNETGPVFRGTLVAGNFLSNPDQDVTGFGNQSRGAIFSAFGEQKPDVYIQDASVKFDTYSLGGVNVDAEFGRLGYQGSEHLFKRVNPNHFLSGNPRWNSGNHMIDGGLLKFRFGKDENSAQLHLIAGRNSETGENEGGKSLNGVGISPIDFSTNPMNGFAFINNALLVGTLTPEVLNTTFTALNLGTPPTHTQINAASFQARQTYGARLYVPFGKMGEANLTGMLFQTNRALVGTAAANRIAVFGADAKVNVTKGISLNVAYGKTPLLDGSKQTLNKDNDYLSGQIGFNTEKFGVKAGYRQIKENYIAPGSWNEGSLFANATGVRGLVGDAWFKPTSKLCLGVYGRVEDNNNHLTLADSTTKVRPRFITVGGHVKFAVSDQFDLSLNGEYVTIDQKATNVEKATSTLFTVKGDYHIGSANLCAGVQYGQHKNFLKNFPVLARATTLKDDSKGGQLFAHVMYKF